MPVETSDFRVAGPVFWVDGQEQGGLAAALLRMEVRQSLTEPATATAAFGMQPVGADNALAVLSLGRRLKIAGDSGAEVLFAGIIDGLSYRYEPDGPPQLVVTAIDDLARLAGPLRSRVFADMTDLQVLAVVASDHSLALDVQVETFYPAPETHVQGEQTDLAFFYERARRAQVFSRATDGAIQVRQPQTAPDGPALAFGAGLHRISLTASLRGQPTETRVAGWDREAGAPVGGVATGAVLGDEADGLVTANDWLEALGASRPAQVTLSVPLTAAEAQRLATTYQLEAGRRFVAGTGESRGSAALHAGSHVTLSGLAPALNGRYFVPAAVHLFDWERGYRTRFEVQRAGLADV